MKKLVLSIAIAIGLAGCSTLIPAFVSKKEGKLCNSSECLEADKYFWDNFHNGAYDSIPNMLDKLMKAYYKNNQDYTLAAHIGFTHAWALAESEKKDVDSPTITDHATLAVKYFKEAFELAPKEDWRIYGFYASFLMAEGSIHNDEKQIVKGYFEMKKAARKYPEFNLFTKAYSIMNAGRRKEAIEDMWKNIDECIGEKADRNNLDYRKYYSLKDVESKMSTCWSTWIAPHNLEGFFLIFGDMYLEENDRKRALMMYKNASYSHTFDQWFYKGKLLQRISMLENAIATEKETAGIEAQDYDQCMVCHYGPAMQLSPADVHLVRPPMEVTLHLKAD